MIIFYANRAETEAKKAEIILQHQDVWDKKEEDDKVKTQQESRKKKEKDEEAETEDMPERKLRNKLKFKPPHNPRSVDTTK